MNENLRKALEEGNEQEKDRFIESAVTAFRTTLTETTKEKHAVFLIYDDESGSMQTYTFNANMTTLTMMLTTAYEMIMESEGGLKRVLN